MSVPSDPAYLAFGTWQTLVGRSRTLDRRSRTGPDTQETTLPGGILLKWYELPPGSPLVDETLESADIGNRTGLTIVAIQRDGEVIDSPGAETTLREGDTLIGVGTPENCEAFEEILTG